MFPADMHHHTGEDTICLAEMVTPAQTDNLLFFFSYQKIQTFEHARKLFLVL